MFLLKRILLIILLSFVGSTVLAVLIYRFSSVPVTPLMIIRICQQISNGEQIKLYHHWVPISKMSKYMPIAVIASEDQRFFEHHGFDFKEINNAINESIKGKRRRGGSTISQQTAKNVFLWPNSSWLRKGLEVYFTFLIEVAWSKERILEVYLNSIEMGNGIYGVDAVAEKHFQTDAKSLTRGQCALIAATLPNPIRFNSKYPSPYMLKRQKAIMREMRHINWGAH